MDDRTNVTDKGYSYGGKNYTYETRMDANNNPYQVAIQSGTPAPYTPPTVVSNYGMNKKVADITAAYNNNATTAVPSFPTGNTQPQPATYDQTSTGEQFIAPQNAQIQPDGSYLFNGQYYTKDQLSSPENVAAIQNTTLQQKKYDQALQSELDAINKRFDIYRQEQQRINQSQIAGTQNALLQSGGGNRGSVAQFAAASADSRVASVMADGQRALQDLDSKRDQLLAEARIAYQDKDYKLLGELNAKIESNRKEMLTLAREKSKKLEEETRAAKMDFDIASVYESGITDPAEILKTLRSKGITNITSKDISSSLKNLVPEGSDELLKTMRLNGAPSDVIQKTVQALATGGLSAALKQAGNYGQGGGSGIIGEYNFYRSQALAAGQTPVDFNTYQNMDANRKAKVAGAGAVTSGAPTSYKEWELAGKPGTYASWLKEQSVKAPTVAQQTVAEYAARIEQAVPTIANLEKAITGMNFAKFETQIKLPATFQSAEVQQYMQAARNFINAKLRRESGAVISDTEFAEARKQYLPQPGDSPEVLTQKKQNRDLVLASLKKAAGPAYSSVDELLGTSQQIMQTEAQAKQEINRIYPTLPQEARSALKTLYEADYSELEVYEYLKSKGLIKN